MFRRGTGGVFLVCCRNFDELRIPIKNFVMKVKSFAKVGIPGMGLKIFS